MVDIMKPFKYASVIGMLLCINAYAVNYSVSGYAYLENQTDHSGVKVKFYNLPSMEPEDSTTSQANGSYSINVSPGYYLVEWTKTGYVPWELGGFALAENTVLDPVYMLAGQVQEVSGNVSGTWTAGFVYYVMDNITVPIGQTLTIDSGVRVKFTKGTSLTCNGKLIVNGTDAKPVLFTSKEPTPLPGDWGNVTLNSTYNSINYLKYEYATDGIVGNYAHYTTVDHLTVEGNLALTARGLYFVNSQNLTFANNYISVAGEYGIYADQAANSNFSGNTIITPTYGLRSDNSTGSTISNNTITTGDNTTGPKNAIYTPNSSQIRIENNTIVADENGIYTPNSFKAAINNNNITGRIYWNGIQFTDSDSSLVSENYVHRTKWNGDDYSWQYLINGENSEYSHIFKNDLYFWNDQEARGNMAIRSEYSSVDSNVINLKMHYYRQYVIYDDRNSDITNNQIKCTLYIHASETAILISNSENEELGLISKNSIELNYIGWDRLERVIWCQNNKIIRNNKITANYIQRAIYCQSNCDVDSNEISGDFDTHVIEIDGNNTTIHDNKTIQTGSGNGVYVQGQTGIEIKNNIFEQSNSSRWLVADNSQINVHHNIVTTGSGRGAYIYNQSGGSLWNNTLVAKNRGDYGVYLENQTNIPVYDNIIAGFQNGLYADNTIKNYNIDHNAFWNLSGLIFNGSAIPPLAGQMIDDNANGDPSDIYENINLNPQFVHPDTNNYNLLGNSPCINAGKNTLKDPDSTVADIGALYYPIYIVINHTQLTSTDNTTGPYPVSAEIISPSGATVTAQVFYSTDNQNFTAVNMTKGTANNYSANIPGQPLNTTIYYYIQANDGVHLVTAPRNLATQVYSFFISLFSQFAKLGGQSAVDGKINLGWATPIPISGTLTGLNLYRSLNANCELITGNLYQTFAADVTQFTDSNVEEGDAYYYRLTGLLTSGETTTESVVSSIVGIMSDNAGIVRVLGTVRLQGQSNHSGVKVYFEKVSPSAVADSLFTASDGKIRIVMKTGIYNIHLTKDGYQPVLLGNRFLSANTQLDTIEMRPGGTMVLKGNIEGILMSSNLHFIDGDVTVPVGKVLTIQAGTTLKFRGDYTFKVEGQILAEGNPDSHIVFTSGMPSPLEGDWKRITLTNAPKSVFKYCEFYFAENGFLLNNSDGSTFDRCNFDRFLLNAIGINDGDYNNNDSLTITNNVFRNTFTRAVSLDRGYGSVISNNDIVVMEWAILCNECDGSEFADNYIHTIGDGNYTGGIHSTSSEGSRYLRNIITGYRDHGIYFNGSANSVLEYNFIADTNQVGNYDGGGTHGLYNDHGNQNCIIRKNKVSIHIAGWSGGYGIICYNSKIDSNSIRASAESHSWVRGVRSDNSSIENNEINIWDDGGYYESFAIEGYGVSTVVRDNTAFCERQVRGFWGNGALIEDNVFNGINNYEWAVGGGPGLKIRNNKFINFNLGLALDNGQDCVIENNEFTLQGDQGGYITGGNNTILKHNAFVLDGDNSYGLKFKGGNAGNIFQNSIVSTKAQLSGTGMIVEDNSHPILNSNLIYGFSTGISASSAVYDLKFNDISNYQTAFAGSGLPNQTGQIVTVNNNLAPSDIYSNILLDPQFVNLAGGDISLKSSSPAINAGDIDSLDVDGTIADIGAKIYNFGFVPQNLAVRSTGDGWVENGWSISATDSLTGYKGYYKLSTASTWTQAGQTTENYLRFTGLTNNVSYDFAIAAVYPSKESLKSRKVSEKPGLVNYQIDPKYLVVFQQTSQTSVKNIAFINNGTKDLTFTLTGAVNSGILSDSTGVVAPGATVNIADTLKGNTTGVKIGKIRVVTNNYPNPLDSICILQVVGTYTALNPVNFTPPSMVDNEFYLILDNGSIDGENLQTGDEVGIFDGEECVGAGGFNGAFPMIITCYGAEGGSPGFTAGDSIIVKLYDASKVRYATVNAANYSFGNGHFIDGGFAIASLQGSVYQNINIPLTANRFNLISSYLYPRYPSASTLFSAIPGLKIAYEDNGAAYIPQYNINTIGDLDITEGYHLFVAGADRTLTVSGLAINPQDFPLILANNRFNSIGYLLDEPADVTAIFAGIVDYISIVQDDDGGVWIPSMDINSLGNLQPLSGYQIFVTGTEPIAFTYPDLTAPLTKKTALVVAPEAQLRQYRFNKTGLPYTIVVTAVTMDGQELADGDEIGVFWNDLCVGATVYQHGKAQVLSAWKGDDELAIQGYKAGDGIHFRAYSQRFKQEFELNAHFAQAEQSRFEGAAYAVVNLQGQPGLIPDRYALYQNYPNPFNSRTVIPYDVPREAEVSLVIYDLLGKEVVRLKDRQFHQPGKYRFEWNGVDRNGVAISSGIYFVRLISKDFQAVHKLVLLK